MNEKIINFLIWAQLVRKDFGIIPEVGNYIERKEAEENEAKQVIIGAVIVFLLIIAWLFEH